MAAALRRSVRTNGGFTLLELLIAVAILGILTGVLVLSFNDPANKVRTGSEANAVFAEFHRAEQQYALEHGSYLSTGTTDSDIYPSTPGRTAQEITRPESWEDLKVQITQKLYCGYVAVAGTADDDIPSFAEDFGMTQPESNWYVLYARCDADGQSAVDAKYFASSVDPTFQSRNEGR